MSSNSYRLWWVLLCLLVSGCASFERYNQQFLYNAVESALEKHEYVTATENLRYIPQTPDSEARIARYQQQIKDGIVGYKKQCRDKADALKSINEWYQSVAHLDVCIENLPEADNLKKYRAIIESSRRTQIADMQLRLNLLEAGHLSKQFPLLERLERLSPPKSLQWWNEYRYKKRQSSMTKKMMACFDDFVGNDLALAERCLLAAKKLSPEIDANKVATNQLLVKKKEQSDSLKKKQRQEAAKIKEKKLVDFKLQYLSHINNDRLPSALEVMQKMKVLAADDKEVNLWDDDLQVMILIKVTHDLDRGKALYSKGFIHQALFLWRPLVELSPDNKEIDDYIQRAERFLQKLNRLENNG